MTRAHLAAAMAAPAFVAAWCLLGALVGAVSP